MSKKYILILHTAYCILYLGCAYNFSGFTTRKVKSIAIPVLENQTTRYGIEEVLTKAVIDAFIQDGRLKVLDRKEAESVLLGEITRYSKAPFSYDEQKNVKDYKVDLSIKLIYLSANRQDESKNDTLETFKKEVADTLLTKTLNDWYTYTVDLTEEHGIGQLCLKLADDIVKVILE